MSYYVHRSRDDREGWIGPIRCERQAHKEKDAWEDAGWTAEVHKSSPEIKAKVATWVKAVAERRARG